jgi:hypothetical protein
MIVVVSFNTGRVRECFVDSRLTQAAFYFSGTEKDKRVLVERQGALYFSC